MSKHGKRDARGNRMPNSDGGHLGRPRTTRYVHGIKFLVNLSKEVIRRLMPVGMGAAVVEWLKAWVHPPQPSVSDWNAFPPSASGKPAPYMALTSEGHLVIQQKRVLAAGNSLSDSEKLQRAAANIGTRTAVTA